MTDPRVSVEDTTNELNAWRTAVKHGTARTLLEGISKAATASGADVLVLKADMVFGMDHLRSALYHAKRSLNEGRNISDSLAMETLLYASGERQLSSAIRKMSVDDATDNIVVARLAGDVNPAEGWEILPDISEGTTLARLAKFGVTDIELATIGDRRPDELVLEKVAAVDVLKK